MKIRHSLFCLAGFALVLLVTASVETVENVPGRIASRRLKGETAANSSNFHKLTASLFSTYDKELVPARPVIVKLEVLLLKVKSTIERDGIFESVVALFVSWQDLRMSWDPQLFDNVSVLAVDSKRVWVPDIAMTNSADHLYSISRDEQFVVRIKHNGMFNYVPTGTAKTWCELKLITFPFDYQTCSLEFESWSLDSSTMAFSEEANVLVDPHFLSTQWTLCSKNASVYEVVYSFSSELFSRAKFDFTVRRKSTFYLVFPCATLSAIQLLVFAIPSIDCSSDRIGFATTNLLTLVVFQTIVTEEMPKTSDAVTALSKYIIALIILSAIAILESVVVEAVRRITSHPPPSFLIKFVFCLPVVWRLDEWNQDMVTPVVSNSFREGHSADGLELEQIPFIDETMSNPRSPKLQRKANKTLNGTLPGRSWENAFERANRERWGAIANRVDLATLIMCCFVAVIAPLAIFLPIIDLSSECQSPESTRGSLFE